jgi:Ala-tRNA(Pro) deacylase
VFFPYLWKEAAMSVEKLKKLLDSEGVKYVMIHHSPAFTAQEIAASAHVSGKILAKAVMVKIDGKMAMAVVPATHHADLDRLKEQTGARDVQLASEPEFKNLFPDCEIGAMPPFGNLYGLNVYIDRDIAEDEEIVFNAGSHQELMKLAFKDYERLVKPTVLEF